MWNVETESNVQYKAVQIVKEYWKRVENLKKNLFNSILIIIFIEEWKYYSISSSNNFFFQFNKSFGRLY